MTAIVNGMSHVQAGVLVVEVGVIAVCALLGTFGPWRRPPSS